MIRYLITLTGRVQGVGFRYFCQLKATELYLTGYVKNLPSGEEVIIEIQGDKHTLDKFINYILKGNNFSRIDDTKLNEIPVIYTEKNFRVKY